MGTLNPLGLNVADTWEAALAGRSGVGPITLFDASDLLVQIGCEIKGFDPANYMEAREMRRRDRFQQFASVVAQEALAQAGVSVEKGREERFGIIVSTAVGGLETMQEGVRTMDAQGPRRVNPFLIPMFMPNGASGLIAIDIGARGPCFSIASACATGADSIGQAALMIRSGMVDVCLAGGTEATITKIGISSFDRLGALSRSNEDYSGTPAPFDKNRDGLVMGEGAAALVLESLEHALAREAAILAEFVGYGSTADAYHVTAPSESGQGGATAIRLALQEAGLRPQDVDYLNAHGTATDLNDVAETKAIKLALGEAAYNVPISSTKSMTGHMMGATGALEAIFCVQAIRDGKIPPTIHFSEPDPECDLDYVPNQARDAKVTVALSNAFGFGGHNAVLAFRAFNE
jgi:beta-ketoacyl-acyl-carrier-protein synthase II